MLVHEFVEGKKPIMILIHGVLTPWQIWTPQIAALKETYNIYVIALSAHTEEAASEFISLESEVEDIIQYFQKQNMNTIDVLCGLSLGGKIAYHIWQDGRLSICNLIMDGAPLVRCPKIAQKIMIKNYISIIRQSKERNEKIIKSFKKQFLPETYLNSYLKIADFMTDSSLKNIVHAAFSGGLRDDVKNQSNILFIHGTKGNELLSKKGAMLMKKFYPKTEIICFKGDTHCYKAIWEPEKWIQTVTAFLNR